MSIYTIMSLYGGPSSNATTTLGYVESKEEAEDKVFELNKGEDALYYFYIKVERLNNDN